MKRIPVDTDSGTIRIPVPSLRHHVARIAYKILLGVLALGAIGVLVRTNDPLAVSGAIVLILPLPALLYVERRISTIQWTEATQVRRGLLFAAEFTIPLFTLLAMASMPMLLQAYGFNPSVNELAFIDIGFMFIAGLGGVLANRVWTLHRLGYER